MKYISYFRLFSVFVCLAALAVYAPVSSAGDHDLQMQDIEVSPYPMEAGCSNRVKPHFSINGLDDHNVLSGGAFVSFSHHIGNQPEVPLSVELPVTYVPGDGQFSIGKAWPDDFASVATGFVDNDSVLMQIENGVTGVTLHAMVRYAPNQTDPDGSPIKENQATAGNNEIDIPIPVITPTKCTITPIELDICKLHPEICHPLQCNFLGCRIFKFDPENCPQCGRLGLYEVTVSLPVDTQLVAYTRDNRVAARSVLMSISVNAGSKTYNQRMILKSTVGESYTFKVLSTKGKAGTVSIKPDIQIRKLESPLNRSGVILKMPAVRNRK